MYSSGDSERVSNAVDLFAAHFIIPAAGSGSRFGGLIPKAFVELRDGRSLVEVVVQQVLSLAIKGKIIVLVPETEIIQARERMAEFGGSVIVAVGGETRQDSIVRGLKVLEDSGANPSDLVVVHDAARCAVPREATLHVIAVARETGAATLAIPVTDALCKSQDSAMISSYVSRENLWSIQTPQAYRFELLCQAHELAQREGMIALDDSEVVSRIQPVSIVRGLRSNIKVTYAEDLALIENIAANGR